MCNCTPFAAAVLLLHCRYRFIALVDRPMGKAAITKIFHLRRSEVVRSWKRDLQAQYSGESSRVGWGTLFIKSKNLQICQRWCSILMGFPKHWDVILYWIKPWGALACKTWQIYVLFKGRNSVSSFQCLWFLLPHMFLVLKNLLLVFLWWWWWRWWLAVIVLSSLHRR